MFGFLEQEFPTFLTHGTHLKCGFGNKKNILEQNLIKFLILFKKYFKQKYQKTTNLTKK